MSRTVYGFRESPFRRVASLGQVFLSTGFETAWTETIDALRHGSRAVLISGDPGTGKTRLMFHMRTCLAQTQPAFYLNCCPLGVAGFIGSAAAALKIKLTSDRTVSPVDAFKNALRARSSNTKVPVLLIDDASKLGAEVLANLMDLFELDADEGPLARLVLAAGRELDETLQLAEIEPLADALATRITLPALSTEEVPQYIAYCLESAGHTAPGLFQDDAVALIARHTRGIPQRINVLCNAALHGAHERGRDHVDGNAVHSALEAVVSNDVTPAPAGTMIRDDLTGHAGAGADRDWWDLGRDDAFVFPIDEEPDIEVWLRKSRPWRLAAMGAGGSVALLAAVILLGAVPIGHNTAAAEKPAASDVGITEHIAELNDEVVQTRAQKADLQAQLSDMLSRKEALSGALQSAETRYERKDEVAQAFTELQADVDNDENFKALQVAFEPPANAASPVTAAAARPAAAAPGTYAVRAGDTLWQIAANHGMRMEHLMSLNAITDANKVITGQRLRFNDDPVGQASGGSTGARAAGDQWYVVRPGDSLYRIGQKTESSVQDLKRWNQIANADHLVVGQRLRLFPADSL